MARVLGDFPGMCEALGSASIIANAPGIFLVSTLLAFSFDPSDFNLCHLVAVSHYY
jgi:hypothetical protein